MQKKFLFFFVNSVKCFTYKTINFNLIFVALLQGCSYRNHTVNATERSSDVFQDMLTYFDLICIAQPTQPAPNENIGLDRILPCYSERALVQWLKALQPDSAELKKVILCFVSSRTFVQIQYFIIVLLFCSQLCKSICLFSMALKQILL